MHSSSQLAMAFGPLEVQVLEALWERAIPSSVHDIEAKFPGCAYTTLMTTMERLFQKGILARAKHSRHFVYRTILTRDEQIASIAEAWFATLLPSDSKLAGPVLSRFVDAVVKRDARLLDDLEQCLRDRRNRLRPPLTGHG
jgi:predicted transcriptional regulator